MHLKPYNSFRNCIRWMCISRMVCHCLCHNNLYQALVLFHIKHIAHCQAFNCKHAFSSQAAGMVAALPRHLTVTIIFAVIVSLSLRIVLQPHWHSHEGSDREAGREDQGVSSNKPEEIMLQCCWGRHRKSSSRAVK